MDTKQLECFITLAQTLNFTASAKLLKISQSSLSRLILSLEEELDSQLFYRNNRSVELTSAGMVFLKEADQIMMHYNKGLVELKKSKTGMVGNLKIGFLRDTLDQDIPNIVNNFHNNFPFINIEFFEYSVAGMIEALRKDLVDIAFTVFMDVPLAADISWRTTSKNELYIAMHENHPLSGRNSLEMSELSNDSFVMMDRNDSTAIFNQATRFCNQNGFSPNIVAYANNISSLLLLAGCGIGISILPLRFKIMASPAIRFVKLQNVEYSTDAIVAWKTSNNNSCLSHFVNEIETYLKKLK